MNIAARVRKGEQASRGTVPCDGRCNTLDPERLNALEKVGDGSVSRLMPCAYCVEHRSTGHLRAFSSLAPGSQAVTDNDQRSEGAACAEPAVLVGFSLRAMARPDHAGTEVIVRVMCRQGCCRPSEVEIVERGRFDSNQGVWVGASGPLGDAHRYPAEELLDLSRLVRAVHLGVRSA